MIRRTGLHKCPNHGLKAQPGRAGQSRSVGYPFVRIHGRKLVLHLIRLNNVLAVSGMVTGKDYWVWGGVKTVNV